MLTTAVHMKCKVALRLGCVAKMRVLRKALLTYKKRGEFLA
jgi:hypothetical protein